MAIWFAHPTIEDARASHTGLLASHLGIEFTEFGADFLRGTMPVEPRTHQPMGYLHGGASLVLAETLGSVAANYVVDRTRQRCLGQEINANHLRPVSDGLVTGIGAPVPPGGAQPGLEHRNPRSAGTTGVRLASHHGRGGMAVAAREGLMEMNVDMW